MKDQSCIFCLLAGGDIPTAKVYEDGDLAVILDAAPAAKGHCLILPKEHYKNVTEVPQELAGKMLVLAGKLGNAMKEKLGAEGFNIIVNTDEAAGQTVFHMHMHVIPRRADDGGVALWTPHEADADENAKLAALLGEGL